jgi:HAD superfamily hydrolase (TIGR01457 family)
VSIAERYRSFLFDLDGVLYRGDQAVEGAADAVRRLRDAGRGIAFVTNNSSKTPEDVAFFLTSLGIEATSADVVTSAVATAELIAARGGGTAFVVGESGIRAALAQAGVHVLDGEPAAADWVVVGWDRGADYAKLRTASLLVQRGATLVATNADAAYPAPDGSWPGAGALLAVITTTTGARAEIVGKPHPPLFEAARDRAGGGPALFVGDRLDTDIAGASALGWDSLLVFTGVTRPADVHHSSVRPTFTGQDLSVLFDEAL